MAVVKIKGDTSDAQNKVRKLRKEVDKLDKECKKPKRIKVSGGSGFGRGASAVGGMMQVAGGNLISQLMGQATQYIGSLGRVATMVIGRSLGLKELEKSFDKVMPKAKQLSELLQTFGSPGETAIERAYALDALDDERRSHNTKSLAEEAGYSSAFSSVAGADGTQIIEKLQTLFEQATSGKISEMTEAWKLLDGFGVTFDDLQNKSTWENLITILKNYGAAGADGHNELQPQMQAIVGQRQMATIRKIGDGTAFENKAMALITDFRERISDEKADKILRAADTAEFLDAQRRNEMFNLPTEALPHTKNGLDYNGHVINHAQSQLETEETKTGLIGGSKSALEALKAEGENIKRDLKPAVDEIGNWGSKQAEIWVDAFKNMMPDWLTSNSNQPQNDVNQEQKQLRLAINDLNRSIKDNSATTQRTTDAMNNLGKVNSNSGSNVAYFA